MEADEALKLIQEAFFRGRFFIEPHAKRRMVQRNVSYQDVRHAVMQASCCQPYRDPNREAKADTSSWRVDGRDFDGDELSVGIDLVRDHLGGFAAVITVF